MSMTRKAHVSYGSGAFDMPLLSWSTVAHSGAPLYAQETQYRAAYAESVL